MKKGIAHIGFIVVFICSSCSNESVETYVATPSPLQIPQLFEDNILNPVLPIDNPQTVEGIALGKKLFFDPILSADNTQACADCHAPENAFSDADRFSAGVDGIRGSRNSMPLFNLAWNYDDKFFWDGSAFSLEHQAFVPVSDPIEMKSSWTQLETELQQHPEYPNLFQQAFGTSKIDSILVTKAIAQFERTLISANSKFDKYLLGEATLTSEELNGFNVFMDETKGDCFHCHGSDKNPLWTDNIFHNNGLDATFTDLGLGAVTGDPADNGKFKTPSLRNLAFTAPYMHDGRFATLDDVINHYSEGLQNSPTIDPLMKKVAQGGVQLSAQDKADLKAFLLALSDDEFISNPNFLNQ
ncbi:cytochrome-c peroxidase [Hwangdonia lutea]|uniref:Cytochrome c peroxidase n=1 Tax=Hwangdonia lutea TaxID=3075823 RepID=A0AA97HRB3_9FLAO|nr:cytochrome c peroxidase [Hwangdonia sp. SCSIO 19198]WOD44761.1 cytochrome c peroxidase [Hwangdonia sp. SCSIO 19198]